MGNDGQIKKTRGYLDLHLIASLVCGLDFSNYYNRLGVLNELIDDSVIEAKALTINSSDSEKVFDSIKKLIDVNDEKADELFTQFIEDIAKKGEDELRQFIEDIETKGEDEARQFIVKIEKSVHKIDLLTQFIENIETKGEDEIRQFIEDYETQDKDEIRQFIVEIQKLAHKREQHRNMLEKQDSYAANLLKQLTDLYDTRNELSGSPFATDIEEKANRIGKINKELKLDVVAGKITPVALNSKGMTFDFIEFYNWAVSKGYELPPDIEAFLTMSLSEFDEWCLKNDFTPPKRFNEARAKAANRAANNEQQASHLTGIKGFDGSQDDNERASTKGIKDKPPRTRKTNLSHAINEAVKTFKKKPSLDELWQFFLADKDSTGIIDDYTDTHLTWKDTKGKLHDTQKETIANHLSRIKS